MKISATVKFLLRRHLAVAALLLALGSALVFGPSLGFPAEWFDDDLYVTGNRFLEMTTANFLHWFTTPILMLHTPLQMHSYMFDRWLWGDDFLIGMHLQNIFWHTAGALGFYLLLLKFGIRKPAALFFALIFSLHPQRLESVVWISERKDVLAFCFAVWALLFFVRALGRGRVSLAAPLLLALSLLGKPAAIMLPAVGAMFVFVFRERPSPRELLRFTLPLFVVSALYMAAYPGQLAFFGGGVTGGAVDIALKSRIIIWNFTAYFWKTFLPLGLNPLYPFHNPGELSPLPGAIAVAAVVAVAVCYWRRRDFAGLKLLAAAAAAFTLTVLPTVGITRVGNTDFADRYSYLPSIFIWLATAVVVRDGLRLHPRLRPAAFAAAAVYAAALTAVSTLYLDTWRNRETFELAAMEPATPNYLAAMTFGLRCWAAGDQAGCRELLDSKLPILPHYSMEVKSAISTYRELLTGLLLLQRGETGAGYDILYPIAASSRRRHLPLYSTEFTPILLGKMAEVALARRDFRTAATLNRELALIGREDGDMVRFYFHTGVACQLERRWLEAENHYLRALELAPGDANIIANLGAVRRFAADDELKKTSSDAILTPVNTAK